ncbi:MAG: hypothetical protein A2W91_13695 [Bacteroidetes bacterium GWF2_38_335]|nr:MAG: hypothetical protein A2W91_13695 [Bacteroidetes bacterium GWF2_38_335]OFY77770.1 MAG: hypothetical protein A2281_15385 [Bacteroidetes bacterium RIFOXYA12_FULL_38_20]HBS87426.1 hypothetical protein [Bacteroidales bacterium]
MAFEKEKLSNYFDFLKPENGKYLPEENAYSHICPVCKKEFIGRRNQRYHPKCKIKLNNDLAREKNDLVKKQMAAYRKNVMILDSIYKKHNESDQGTVIVDLSLIRQSGFLFDAPIYPIKNKENNVEWYAVGQYSYRVQEGKMYIYKLK